MSENENEYYCINCGKKTQSLFKKYSETVLKLTECTSCHQIADKYVEYDLVIIVIDLILLNNGAYRHILLNTTFKNYWKLAVILVLLESYTNWSLSSEKTVNKSCDQSNSTEPKLSDFDMNVEDLKFYVICLNVAFGYICLLLSVYILTRIYWHYIKRNENVGTPFVLILKTFTLASAGIFLQLPSVIWDISLYGYHLHFITLYICLSQLLAYRVICNCPKPWCLVVIFSSHYLKSIVTTCLSQGLDHFIFIK